MTMLFFRARLSCTSLVFRRHYSKASLPDPRPELRNEIKVAMKNRDTHTSMTLRSVLSEIDSAEKTSKSELSSSDVVRIIREAVERRVVAANMFTTADRPQLAEKEQKEAVLLSKFVPPLMSTHEIDTHISAILANLTDINDPRKILPLILKEFYSQVDKSSVNRNLVKDRTQELLELARLGKQ